MENEIETGMSQAYLRFRAFRVRLRGQWFRV